MSLVRDIDSPETPAVHQPHASHKSAKTSMSTMPLKVFFITLVVAILLGTGSGWALGHGNAEKTTASTNTTSSGGSDTGAPKTAGVEDKTTFKDMAEGTLQKGGFEGEGSFHLIRPGGDSQTVYLTSSTVDLSTYIGKKIRVHGQTIAGQKASWLMDVGYVELLQ